MKQAELAKKKKGKIDKHHDATPRRKSSFTTVPTRRRLPTLINKTHENFERKLRRLLTTVCFDYSMRRGDIVTFSFFGTAANEEQGTHEASPARAGGPNLCGKRRELMLYRYRCSCLESLRSTCICKIGCHLLRTLD